MPDKRLGTDPLDWIKDSRGKDEKPEPSTQRTKKTPQKGLKEGWTRATFIVRESHLEKLKDLAYWERKQIKELVDEIFGSYLQGKRIKKRS